VWWRGKRSASDIVANDDLEGLVRAGEQAALPRPNMIDSHRQQAAPTRNIKDVFHETIDLSRVRDYSPQISARFSAHH
jgi:hypothetical protein